MVDTPGLRWWAAIPPELHLKRSDLCAQCAAIDFRAVFTFPDEGDSLVHKYIGISEKNSACQFCRYLAYPRRALDRELAYELDLIDLKYDIIFHENPEPYKPKHFRYVRPRSSSSVYITIDPDYGVGTLNWTGRFPHIWNTRIKCHLDKPIRVAGRPQIVSPVFDHSLARAWFDACANDHPGCAIDCHSEMPKTRLIDCESRRLVSVGGQGDTQMRQFVALSYVWGQPKTSDRQKAEPEQSTAAEDLPSDLPRTIDDAVTVTKALGFQYLWVDQYCIDQRDDEDKKKQVAHMDLIYQYAEITIIAAAGEDCFHGLPGVGDCPREVLDPFILDLDDGRPALTFGILPHSPVHPAQGLESHWQSGKWHTRGWTFQEAHLSKRRLVFSQTAMHFECSYGKLQTEQSGGVECAFSPSYNRDDYTNWIHIVSVLGKYTLSRPGKLPGWGQYLDSDLEKLEVSLRLYIELVTQYTTKNLSWPSDGLNAFRGAANALQLTGPQRYPVYSVAGIPFALGDETSGIHNRAEVTFSNGLAWEPQSRKSSTGALDSIFPSWSWGNVSKWNIVWDLDSLVGNDVLEYPSNVRIEFEGMGQLVALDEFAEACRKLAPLSRLTPKALCVKARILSARVTSGYYETKRAQLALRGFGFWDTGRKFSVYLPLLVNVGVAANEKQDDRPQSSSVQESGNFHGRCLRYDDDVIFAIKSGDFSLLLLRCTDKEAIALLVKWLPEVDEKTACRVGMIKVEAHDLCGNLPPHDKNFWHLFSTEKEVRLI